MISMQTNVTSLSAQRNLAQTQNAMSQNISRLSSGNRINRAGDDAAGLAITSRLSAQIRGLEQAERNSNDAISMIQTAEGGLSEVNNLLTRMRELAVQSANGGTLSTEERGHLDDEFQALSSEIDRIVNVTDYNGQALLDGSLSGGVDFQVGTFNTADDRISLTLGASDTTTLGVDTLDLTSQANAQTAIDSLDTAIDSVSGLRGDLGAVQNRLNSTLSNLGNMHENLSAANSRIMDVDVAKETASMTKNQILSQAGVSVLAQANQMPQMALSLLG